MKTKRVIVYFEYEVDVSDLDPEFVDIDGFAEDEAFRMFEDDFIHCGFVPDDFNTAIV